MPHLIKKWPDAFLLEKEEGYGEKCFGDIFIASPTAKEPPIEVKSRS